VLKEEEDIVVKYAKLNPGIGYKKLTYQMIVDIIVYLTLKTALRNPNKL
jgi:hypothetical protein